MSLDTLHFYYSLSCQELIIYNPRQYLAERTHQKSGVSTKRKWKVQLEKNRKYILRKKNI